MAYQIGKKEKITSKLEFNSFYKLIRKVYIEKVCYFLFYYYFLNNSHVKYFTFSCFSTDLHICNLSPIGLQKLQKAN